MIKNKTLKRQGDWKCIICNNLNFAFRDECNRCKLISRQQNDHQVNMLAYNHYPSFLTPLRKKQNIQQREQKYQEKLLSVSPVLRQLGL